MLTVVDAPLVVGGRHQRALFAFLRGHYHSARPRVGIQVDLQAEFAGLVTVEVEHLARRIGSCEGEAAAFTPAVAIGSLRREYACIDRARILRHPGRQVVRGAAELHGGIAAVIVVGRDAEAAVAGLVEGYGTFLAGSPVANVRVPAPLSVFTRLYSDCLR